jgi:DNA polymerase III delta prime subunit
MPKNTEKFDFGSYDFKRSMLFCGPTGTGKTYKATALLQEYVDAKEEKHKLDTYCISDGFFKQMVKSNMMILRKPDEWQSPITAFPLEVMLRCQILLYDDV